MRQLDKCYKELLDAGLIDEDEYYRYTGDFDLYLYDDFDDWDDPDDVVNYELDDFFDLCDNIRVWVPIR